MSAPVKFFSLAGNTLRTETTVYVRVYGALDEDIMTLDLAKMFR
jgi:hypothetical protein